MDQKEAEIWRLMRAEGKRYFLWRGALMWFLFYLIGVAVWRLFRIYGTGKPFEFLYERIDEAIVTGLGGALAGYVNAKIHWNKYERDHAAGLENKGGAPAQSLPPR